MKDYVSSLKNAIALAIKANRDPAVIDVLKAELVDAIRAQSAKELDEQLSRIDNIGSSASDNLRSALSNLAAKVSAKLAPNS